MHNRMRLAALACALPLIGLAYAANQAPAKATAQTARAWSATGGDVGIRWNHELLRDLKIRLVDAAPRGKRTSDVTDNLRAEPSGNLKFRVDAGYMRGFVGGQVSVRNGYVLRLPGNGAVDLREFRFVPDARNAMRLNLVDARGTAWFYVDRVMHELLDQQRSLTVSSSDLRMSTRLARLIGHPETAGWAVAEVQLDLPVTARGSGGNAKTLAPTIQWHGDPAPNGGTYLNDLMMLETSAQYMRCDGCTGNAGSGRVVIAPSSTLRNNVNQGNIAATVPGDPRGTSEVRYAASIPWYQKFSGQFPPYNNDQHPFLIWNMYRFNADGSLEQVGRSGVKQAYLTTNGSCMDTNDHNSHVLGRGCIDTYSSGNNDYTNGLSPRSEILPASGRWARCGSTFDPNCDGAMDNAPNDPYLYRMIVGESQISPTVNPGASWMLESWYLARQDVDIYNSMSTLRTTQAWSGGVWDVNYSDEKLGAAIDRWVPPSSQFTRGQVPPVVGGSAGSRGGAVGPGSARARGTGLQPRMRMNQELVTADGGHAKVAVRVIDLGNGSWRYHYAVMNFDITAFTTSGSEPNLRVTSNLGFGNFALMSSASASAAVFRDGDLSSGNDWQFSQGSGTIGWSNTGGAASSLFWGTLYSFSITAAAPPVQGQARLRIDTAAPQTYMVTTLVPGA